MDVAVALCSKDAALGQRKIFVTFDLSKVKDHLRIAILKFQSKM